MSLNSTHQFVLQSYALCDLLTQVLWSDFKVVKYSQVREMPRFFMNINEDNLIHVGLIRFIGIVCTFPWRQPESTRGVCHLMWIAAL